MTTLKANNDIHSLKITTVHVEEMLVRDEQTNDLYLPLFSTVVLKCRKEMLSVPPEFKIGLIMTP